MRLAGLAAIAGLVLLATAAVGCGSSPNEHVQSNEFFRPAAASSEQQDQAQTEQQQEQPAASEDGQSAEQQQAQQQQAQPEPQQQQQQVQQQQSEPDTQPDAPLETSDDVIRRYTNPSYGYSFELICSPFCDPNSNGVDRVSFLSETGRALIGADVLLDDGTDTETLLRTTFAIPDTVEFSAQADTTTVTGEAAERLDWDEDRRATGGFQVRWSVLVVRVQDLVILLRAGAVLDDHEAVAPALERALGSFILPLELTARPGRYNRFEFVIDYDPADVAQEFGQPTVNPPSDESGIFVLQSTNALKAVLTWQVLGEAFYDGDTAIQQSLSESLGIENVTNFTDAGEVDGQPARTGETETAFGEGVMMVRSYAWYCRDSGREFVLHVLDPEDPQAVAQPLLESFRCTSD